MAEKLDPSASIDVVGGNYFFQPMIVSDQAQTLLNGQPLPAGDQPVPSAIPGSQLGQYVFEDTSISVDDVIGVDAAFGNAGSGYINVQLVANPSAPASTTLAISAPASATVKQNQATPIVGVSISESGSSPGETFEVSFLDNDGNLSATGSGVTGAGTTSLNIIGSLSQVNSALSTLTDTDATTAPDSIEVGVEDSLGSIVGPQTIAVSVSGVSIAPAPATGLLGGLSANQQLELIYIAYFNRAADGAGFNYWVGQNAALSLTSIANAFAPQAETIALYPFLGTPNLNLSTPTAQSGLTTFINSVYQNMFGHAADAAGAAYWLGQITSGATGLGAAALSIANGATGTDAIEVQNKITVALDFTTRTQAAGLGLTNIPAAFLTEAHTVLNGVDGTSLNDTSVTVGEGATTAYISGAKTGATTVLTTSADPASVSPTNAPITISASNSVIDPGVGSYMIQFLAGASADMLVLHANGVDQISGFDPATDVLDLRSLLSETNVNLNGDIAALPSYLSVTDQGANALISFDPSGNGGGSVVAVLQGLGSAVTGTDMLIAQGAIQIA